MITAIKCAIELQKDLATNYNKPLLCTSSITQDFLESFFSVIRSMGGANTNPDTFMFLQRVKQYVTQKILEDEDFDIFSLKEKLEQERDLSDLDHDCLSDALQPEELSAVESIQVIHDDVSLTLMKKVNSNKFWMMKLLKNSSNLQSQKNLMVLQRLPTSRESFT